MHRHETIHTGLMTAQDLIERGLSFTLPGGSQLETPRAKGAVLQVPYYLCDHYVVHEDTLKKPRLSYSFKLRRAGFFERGLDPNEGFTVRIPTRTGKVRMHMLFEEAHRPLGRNVPDTPAQPKKAVRENMGEPVMI